jgi:hypothetical protein
MSIVATFKGKQVVSENDLFFFGASLLADDQKIMRMTNTQLRFYYLSMFVGYDIFEVLTAAEKKLLLFCQNVGALVLNENLKQRLRILRRKS